MSHSSDIVQTHTTKHSSFIAMCRRWDDASMPVNHVNEKSIRSVAAPKNGKECIRSSPMDASVAVASAINHLLIKIIG